MSINTRALSGFLELLPQEQVEFDRVKSLIEETYRQFGFTSLDTPLIERSEVLLAKGGSETDKQVYFVANGLYAKEKDALALRFDLTIPLARYVAEHFNELTFPFRRCHIGKVYRGERAQKGRFREFYQCDIDVIGRNELSLYYDAELPAIIYQLFKKMDIGKFTIRINNRKVLGGFFAELGLSELSADVLRVIDKSEKITHDQLLASFAELGLNQRQIDSIAAFMKIKGDVSGVLQSLNQLGIENELFAEGVSELKLVTDLMLQMDVKENYFTIDLSIARGLDYYTGTVYETTLDDTPIGSICGGGRYDNLAGHYRTEKLPGAGISIGLTRLFWQLRENGLLKNADKSVSDAVIITESAKNMPNAFKAASALREKGLSVDILFEDMPMKKKFQYVTKKDAPYLIVARNDDSGNDVLSLQYKGEGGEFVKEVLPIEEIVTIVSKFEK